MKKIFSLIFLGAIVVACTKDDPASIDAPENFNSTTSTIVDFEAINPVTDTPNRAFDNSSNGMYHGIAVTSDVSVHAKIWVNVANDGNYNATIVTDKGEQMAFYGTPTSRSQEVVSFTGKNGSFIFDTGDLDNPIATNVILNDKEGYIQTVKDRSDQRAAVALGTYVDNGDAAFTGSWDLITDGTPAYNFVGTDLATPISMPALTQVCIVGPEGVMYVDDVLDLMDFPCVGVTQGPPAFYSVDAGVDPTSANEFWAMDQTLDINGLPAIYTLGQSSVISTAFEVSDTMILNNDLNGTAGCFTLPGVKGLWAWNGRTGSVFFTDPFDFVAPPTFSENTDASSSISETSFNGSLPSATIIENTSK